MVFAQTVFGLIVNIVVGPQMIVRLKTTTVALGQHGQKCSITIQKMSFIGFWNFFFMLAGQVIF